jgi:hypothetical protein
LSLQLSSWFLIFVAASPIPSAWWRWTLHPPSNTEFLGLHRFSFHFFLFFRFVLHWCETGSQKRMATWTKSSPICQWLSGFASTFFSIACFVCYFSLLFCLGWRGVGCVSPSYPVAEFVGLHVCNTVFSGIVMSWYPVAGRHLFVRAFVPLIYFLERSTAIDTRMLSDWGHRT